MITAVAEAACKLARERATMASRCARKSIRSYLSSEGPRYAARRAELRRKVSNPRPSQLVHQSSLPNAAKGYPRIT